MAEMKLSKAQQSKLWPMLAAAWRRHAENQGLRASDAKAKDQWRRAYLAGKCGIWSLKQIPRGGKLFAQVMGALQEVAQNGIEWLVREQQDEREGMLKHVFDMCQKAGIAYSYALGIARNMFQQPDLAGLDGLSYAELSRFSKALHAQIDRIKEAAS
jgi:hypothetical protein